MLDSFNLKATQFSNVRVISIQYCWDNMCFVSVITDIKIISETSISQYEAQNLSHSQHFHDRNISLSSTEK